MLNYAVLIDFNQFFSTQKASHYLSKTLDRNLPLLCNPTPQKIQEVKKYFLELPVFNPIELKILIYATILTKLPVYIQFDHHLLSKDTVKTILQEHLEFSKQFLAKIKFIHSSLQSIITPKSLLDLTFYNGSDEANHLIFITHQKNLACKNISVYSRYDDLSCKTAYFQQIMLRLGLQQAYYYLIQGIKVKYPKIPLPIQELTHTQNNHMKIIELLVSSVRIFETEIRESKSIENQQKIKDFTLGPAF